MQNTRARVEARLERMLSATPPPTGRQAAVSAHIDLVFLAKDDQRGLDQSMRQP
jgi:hypothetical protein